MKKSKQVSGGAVALLLSTIVLIGVTIFLLLREDSDRPGATAVNTQNQPDARASGGEVWPSEVGPVDPKIRMRLWD